VVMFSVQSGRDARSAESGTSTIPLVSKKKLRGQGELRLEHPLII